MEANIRSTAKSVFSSDELPKELDDDARFRLWRDIYAARHGECDIARAADRPFLARSKFMLVGAVGLAKFNATFQRLTRTAGQVAADARDDFLIGFNRGGTQAYTQRGHEVTDKTGGALFFTNAEPGEARMEIHSAVVGLIVPRAKIYERVAGADDLICTSLDPDNTATRYLGRYLDFLLGSAVTGDGEFPGDHVSTTLLDLATLALGARRDAAELARSRGLRAAHIQAILAKIRASFTDPAFSARDVARAIGLAPHYVQNLLSETGTNFTERVLELRLQKARTMLANPQCDRMKISEIAWNCGFNEVSYFNRCFRRRFGASPTEYRGSSNT